MSASGELGFHNSNHQIGSCLGPVVTHLGASHAEAQLHTAAHTLEATQEVSSAEGGGGQIFCKREEDLKQEGRDHEKKEDL